MAKKLGPRKIRVQKFVCVICQNPSKRKAKNRPRICLVCAEKNRKESQREVNAFEKQHRAQMKAEGREKEFKAPTVTVSGKSTDVLIHEMQDRAWSTRFVE